MRSTLHRQGGDGHSPCLKIIRRASTQGVQVERFDRNGLVLQRNANPPILEGLIMTLDMTLDRVVRLVVTNVLVETPFGGSVDPPEHRQGGAEPAQPPTTTCTAFQLIPHIRHERSYLRIGQAGGGDDLWRYSHVWVQERLVGAAGSAADAALA
eukprot:CAMPEP_0183762590 /NCGR_PEP_ID=MMETSP0739-20130205/9176_1 /TAXON_ID=385413 /ORGANISM="Thalassiosira miniscula, Strain CCMP1093" /LENGTH=153 /DNA_ID=CAMNT_0026000901 /DNA_START=272 /DNA_END=729 /DNA_ORIENTATION=-